MSRRVFVTGSTGRVGKEVVARLSKSGDFIVRAAVHSAEKADWLKSIGAHETVTFDLTKQETWRPALEGVDVLFSSSLDPLIQGHLDFMTMIKKDVDDNKCQLKHVVRISCFGAETNTAVYNSDMHVSREGACIPLILQHYWWGEEACVKTGLPTTGIRGNFYMNHLLKNEQESIKKDGVFRSPLGNTRNSFVSTNDMGEVAALCITEGPQRHGNKFYDITGPEPLSMHDVAKTLGDAMGKKVVYEPLEMTQFEKDFGPARAEFFEYLNNGFYSRCSPDFYNLTGRRPITYAEYLKVKGAAGDTGLDELFQAGMYKKGEDRFKGLDQIKKS